MIHIPFDLTIIIPTFNEGDLLKKIVDQTIQEAKTNKLNTFEIIIVNDGSTDQTAQIANKLAKKYSNISTVTHTHRLGFGSSITSGLQKAKYQYVTFLPSDGQVYLRDLIPILQKAQNSDLIITYRKTKPDYSFFRKILSFGFKTIMKIFFGLSYKDYNWAQIYKKRIFTEIHPESKGVFFLGETVVKAEKLNFNISEAETIYRSRISGKSKNANFRVAAETLKEMFIVWFKFVFKK